MQIEFPEPTLHAVVHTPYVPGTDPEVRLTEGETVTLAAADPEYSLWFWCTTDDGRATHVPAQWLDVEYPPDRKLYTDGEYTGPSKDALLEELRRGERSELQAVLRQDFASTELGVAPQDIVVIAGRAGGWVYVRRTPDGAEGWIPAECVDVHAGGEFSRRGQGRHENERDTRNSRQGRADYPENSGHNLHRA